MSNHKSSSVTIKGDVKFDGRGSSCDNMQTIHMPPFHGDDWCSGEDEFGGPAFARSLSSETIVSDKPTEMEVYVSVQHAIPKQIGVGMWLE
jgi:hypothetical protein